MTTEQLEMLAEFEDAKDIIYEGQTFNISNPGGEDYIGTALEDEYFDETLGRAVRCSIPGVKGNMYRGMERNLIAVRDYPYSNYNLI